MLEPAFRIEARAPSFPGCTPDPCHHHEKRQAFQHCLLTGLRPPFLASPCLGPAAGHYPLGAACDFIAQKDLTPGQSTEADVRRWMGQPEMIWEESDGSRTLEYPRGPMGKETYFVTIGADGRYRRIEQVLTEENFRKVQPGMTRDQVRQILGKPGEISRFKRQNEEVWGWRYLEATQRTMFFYAHFDQDTGLLKRTDQMQDWKTSKH